MRQHAKRRRQSGFTLLEMVLVLIILATIAGLVIPQLGFLGRTADMAATAKTQQDIANQLSLYFVLQKKAPSRTDSLLTTTGTIINPVNAAGTLITSSAQQNDQVWGLPYAGANDIKLHLALTPATIDNTTNGELNRSFTRLGFDTLMDHVNTVTVSPNDSGQASRNLASGSNLVATLNLGTVEGQKCLTQLYPNLWDGVTPLVANGLALPTGVGQIVAVGIGPRNSMIPDTMLNAPSYPGSEKYYGRYIAWYALFPTGERAQLIGVSDAYGRFPNYSQQQFNQSLPNNARQG